MGNSQPQPTNYTYKSPAKSPQKPTTPKKMPKIKLFKSPPAPLGPKEKEEVLMESLRRNVNHKTTYIEESWQQLRGEFSLQNKMWVDTEGKGNPQVSEIRKLFADAIYENQVEKLGTIIKKAKKYNLLITHKFKKAIDRVVVGEDAVIISRSLVLAFRDRDLLQVDTWVEAAQNNKCLMTCELFPQDLLLDVQAMWRRYRERVRRRAQQKQEYLDFVSSVRKNPTVNTLKDVLKDPRRFSCFNESSPLDLSDIEDLLDTMQNHTFKNPHADRYKTPPRTQEPVHHPRNCCSASPERNHNISHNVRHSTGRFSASKQFLYSTPDRSNSQSTYCYVNTSPRKFSTHLNPEMNKSSHYPSSTKSERHNRQESDSPDRGRGRYTADEDRTRQPSYQSTRASENSYSTEYNRNSADRGHERHNSAYSNTHEKKTENPNMRASFGGFSSSHYQQSSESSQEKKGEKSERAKNTRQNFPKQPKEHYDTWEEQKKAEKDEERNRGTTRQKQSDAERREALNLLKIKEDEPNLADLKNAYRKAAMEYHPDRRQNHSNPTAAKEMFQKVQNAFEFLAGAIPDSES